MSKITLLTLIIMYALGINAQVINGTFEQGSAVGWGKYSKYGHAIIGTAETLSFSEVDPPVYPYSGQYMARLGGYEYDEMAIGQTVTLPNTPEVYMRLYIQSRTSSTSECAGLWVGAEIKIVIADEDLYETYLCQYNDWNEWTYAYINVSKYAGQTVLFGFTAEAASSVWSFIYLDNISFTSSLTTAVNDNFQPLEFKLEQNYPNPFNPTTTINYEVPEPGNVKIVVMNSLGEAVAEIINQYQDSGVHEVSFDGSGLSSGIYFYRLETASKIITKKMTLIK